MQLKRLGTALRCLSSEEAEGPRKCLIERTHNLPSRISRQMVLSIPMLYFMLLGFFSVPSGGWPTHRHTSLSYRLSDAPIQFIIGAGSIKVCGLVLR